MPGTDPTASGPAATDCSLDRGVDSLRLDYDDLDRLAAAEQGESFHRYVMGSTPTADLFSGEAEFRAFLERYLTVLRVGDHRAELALYTYHAYEADFTATDRDELRISAFSGMNIPHHRVVSMFDEFHGDLRRQADGCLQGVVEVPLRGEAGRVRDTIRIDFDRNTITPPVTVEDQLGIGRAVTARDVARFVSYYLDADSGPIIVRRDDGWAVNTAVAQPQALQLFSRSPDLPTIRHEVFHVLYSAHAPYREHIKALARHADQRQREMAVLFAALHYRVLDSRMAAVNPHIVLDEAFNAYHFGGRYDPETGASWYPVSGFARAHGIVFELNEYATIAQLPILASERAVIQRMYRHARSDDHDLDEAGFLRANADRVLANTGSMSFLHELVMTQHPDLYADVRRARRELLDALL